MRSPKPFFRKSTNCWYLQLGSKQIRLAEDRAESFRLWHKIMADGLPKEGPKVEVWTVKKLTEKFLQHTKATSAPRTVQWYEQFFDLFLPTLPEDMPAESCRVFHVTEAINAHPTWKANTKHNYARAIKRLFTWSRQQGYIAVNPIENLQSYRTEAREDCVTPEQWSKIEPAALPDFRDLLLLAWDTGMRPQELVTLEARHVKLRMRQIRFTAAEAKGKRPRTIYLGTDRAVELLADLMRLRPTGPLLRNSKGKPWNRMSIKCAFASIAKATGIRTHLGALRKGYCTEALKAGLDTVTVSGLLGHANGVMVSRVYAKVQHDQKFMAEAAVRAKR